MRRSLTDEEFFADRYDVSDSGCWEWTSHRNGDGYGVFARRRKTQYAHRVAYAMFVGPIPKGLTIDHLCRNRGCVNPAHLEPVTAKENVLRSPHTWGGRHRIRTHCPKGHVYDEANTILPRRGGRECLACRRAAGKTLATQKRRAAGKIERAKFCKNGHPRTAENTEVSGDGSRRRCRICRQEQKRRSHS